MSIYFIENTEELFPDLKDMSLEFPENEHIIYETGEWSAKKWENVQKVTDDYFYVSTGAIESFGESNK